MSRKFQKSATILSCNEKDGRHGVGHGGRHGGGHGGQQGGRHGGRQKRKKVDDMELDMVVANPA